MAGEARGCEYRSPASRREKLASMGGSERRGSPVAIFLVSGRCHGARQQAACLRADCLLVEDGPAHQGKASSSAGAFFVSGASVHQQR
ncbi:hypothetical protein K523DRAFT_94404 [Schizophyllum commune Tattone D]|nr:hypothetical protein K523DRAFT_94404 [Schizophyllum commune Tattone D]